MGGGGWDTGCIETRTCVIWMRHDGIIEARIKAGAHLTVYDGRENLRGVMELSRGKRAPLLKDCAELGGMGKAYRDLYAGTEVASIHTACAILVGHVLSRAVGSFLVGMNRPLTPHRLFTEKRGAIDWLRTYLDAPAP